MTSFSQKDGNIVEYFGREAVEEINEGTVFHVFREGLMLPAGPRAGGVLPTTDVVAWHLAKGTWQTPQDGQLLHPMHSGEDSLYTWQNLKADDEGLFQRRELRRAYLYTHIESPREEIVLLDARGHTRIFINGLPYAGDHYDFGYTLIPFKMKEGVNEFVYAPGRFGRVTSKLVSPKKPVMLTSRDMTLPSLINGETEKKWGAVRVINAQEKDLTGLSIRCILESGESADFATGDVMELSVRKVNFQIPSTSVKQTSGKVNATLVLSDSKGNEVDRLSFVLNQREATKHHDRTFISRVDGSVQYYSVAPSTKAEDGQALVLSVHGAGVEARNQANAYGQKDWCHVVAATNRRPYGFNWEDWGRIDAMEVLNEARQVFKTDPQLTYLTGHSMGGHGTWQIGVTYPDQFAAIAPCASYPDILGYRRDGKTPGYEDNVHYQMLKRSANGGRTLELKRNYLQSGVYIFHGSDDTVVPVEQARFMRETLGTYHPNFVYYEYPGGTHWFGNHSVDWKPIFNYFKWQSIPEDKEMNHIEFHTASPGISASSHWITISQQEEPLEFSSVDFNQVGDTIRGEVKNVEGLSFELSKLQFDGEPVIIIGGQTIRPEKAKDLFVKIVNGAWKISEMNTHEKYPGRNGGFKNAFDNHVVLVYATDGSREENEWYQNKARYDAERFQYKANGSIEVIADREFEPEAYADRNVVLYGNADNNRAWDQLLSESPVVVKDGEIVFGRTVYKGDDLGTCFIYPRSDSDKASVGVVAGTGDQGMRATYSNDYFSGYNGYPDLLIFDTSYLKEGLNGILVSGFFDNQWKIKNEFFH